MLTRWDVQVNRRKVTYPFLPFEVEDRSEQVSMMAAFADDVTVETLMRENAELRRMYTFAFKQYSSYGATPTLEDVLARVRR